MNLDPALLEIIVCPDCRGGARRRRGGRRAGVHRLRPGLPGPRRHPGPAGRRGPPARDRRPGDGRRRSTTSRLDDEAALARADHALRAARRGRRPGPPRGRRRRRGDRRGRRRRRSARPGRAPWSPPAPTPGCCAPCSSRGARCRSWPGPARRCPAGPAASTWSSCSRPRAATPAPRRAVAEAVRRGCQRRRRLPAATRWSPSTPPGRDAHRAADRDRRPARHRGGDARVPRPGRPRPATPTPRRSPTALDDVAIACSPHRDLAVNPAKMLAIALADATPLVWGGSVLAARAARRVAESIRRASGRTALAGDAEHLLPVIAAARAARRVRRPVRRRRRAASRGRRWWSSTTAPRTRRSASSAAGCEPRPRERAASASRRSPARPTATWPATPRCSSTGTYAAAYLRARPRPTAEPRSRPGPTSAAAHVSRRRHQGSRGGAAGQHRASRSRSSWRSLLTGASSMLAEAIHSVADSGNQGCCCSAASRSRKEAHRGAPVRLRPRALHLLVHRRDRAVLRRRPVRALRGVPQVPRGPRRARRNELARRPVVVGAARRARWSRSCMEGLSFRTAIRETNKIRGRRVVVAVHPARQAARAAGDPARGLRRADRPRARAARRRR